MMCPVCGYERTKVVDSRPNDEETVRRRECPKCLSRWLTQERIVRIIEPKKERSKNNGIR